MACSGSEAISVADTTALSDSADTFLDVPARDADGDGSPDEEDCAPQDETVYPGADEICDDRVDQDCDGTTDGCRLSGDRETTSADLRFYGTEADDVLGYYSLFLPDADGDGNDELFLVRGKNFGPPERNAAFVFFGGRTEGGAAEDAELTVLQWDNRGIGDCPDYGDFDADGVLDVVTEADGYGVVGFFPITRAGVVPADQIGHRIYQADGDASFYCAAAWRTGDAGDALVIEGNGYHTERYVSHRVFLPPVTEGSSDEADILIWTDDVWLEAGSAVSVGDTEGTGAGSLAIEASWLQGNSDATGGILLFDSVPTDGSTLSAADEVVYGGWDASGYSSGLIPGGGGDFDGDGYGDIFVQSTAANDAHIGCVYVIHGPLLDESELLDAPSRICGDDETDSLGWHSSAGDIDGDGRVDLALGESGDSETGRGGVRVWYGPLPTGDIVAPAADATIFGGTQYEEARTPVAGGDFDGDGRDDIVVQSNDYSAVASAAGAAFLFYGHGM